VRQEIPFLPLTQTLTDHSETADASRCARTIFDLSGDDADEMLANGSIVGYRSIHRGIVAKDTG
jgi:hypothetical protein